MFVLCLFNLFLFALEAEVAVVSSSPELLCWCCNNDVGSLYIWCRAGYSICYDCLLVTNSKSITVPLLKFRFCRDCNTRFVFFCPKCGSKGV